MATVFIHTLQERQQEEAACVQRIVNYGGFLFLKFYIAYDFEIKYKITKKGSFHETANRRAFLCFKWI